MSNSFYSAGGGGGHAQLSRGKFFKKDNADEFDMEDGGGNNGGYDDSNCDEDDELDDEEMDEEKADRDNYGEEELILDSEYFNENSRDNNLNSQLNEKEIKNGEPNHLAKSKLNSISNDDNENDIKKSSKLKIS